MDEPYGTAVIRLVGGPANGLVFVVPQARIPRFFGIGYSVSRYEAQAGNGDVRIFRYVSVAESKKVPAILLGGR
jgi:hypothetical protein